MPGCRTEPAWLAVALEIPTEPSDCPQRVPVPNGAVQSAHRLRTPSTPLPRTGSPLLSSPEWGAHSARGPSQVETVWLPCHDLLRSFQDQGVWSWVPSHSERATPLELLIASMDDAWCQRDSRAGEPWRQLKQSRAHC